uniref:Death domain-containing protein n=1 Tax=Mesocestoides corti TaxID=53468 RepID=A0A5K3EJS9_MESCO
MDAHAKVNFTTLTSGITKDAFCVIQNRQICRFFKKLPTQEIIEKLKLLKKGNVIVITRCRLDKHNFFIKVFDKLQMLVITDCKMDFLPSVNDTRFLTYLDLSFNCISNLPSDIGLLSKLRVLKLAGNRITNVPREVAGLELLQVLDLSNNMISYFPSDVCLMHSLKYLDCSSNSLSKLPNTISTLPRLEVLFLTNNKLTCLPKNFSLLKELKRLKLGSNRFEHVPFCVFECSALKEFVFTYNQASGVVPDNFCRLTDLEILCLAFNKFTKLPGKLSSLSKLKFLNIRGNRIENIPEAIITKCKKLTVLNCSSCSLNRVPEALGLGEKLCVLDLSNNALEQLPSEGRELKSLTALFVAHNGISVLPDWICGSHNIIAISLRNNKLQHLPEKFNKVAENLRVIDLSHNFFERVSTSLLPVNSKLMYFLMDYNPLLHLPSEIRNLKFLTHLSISNCPCIHELPEEIGELSKLRVLRLSSNSLSSLPRSLYCLTNLHYLDLSDNKFSRFPVVVCFITHLKVLLYNNCCQICTYAYPDPEGWFDRTSLIDPGASMDKLGKDYLEEIEAPIDDEKSISLDEALAAEEEAKKVPQIKPEEIAKLVYRREANKIPSLLCRLKFLVHLSMQQNGLYFFPDIFNKLKRLKRLYLNDNNLRKIPKSLASCKTLNHISLANNKLTEINTDIHRLPNLTQLDLDGNKFPTGLSEVIKHSTLKGLCAYLEADSRNTSYILRCMCEKFVTQVKQDDWPMIMQRLGLSESTIQHIEEELPGGYNFHSRVRRSLEYWTGLSLSTEQSNAETKTPAETTTEPLDLITTTTADVDDHPERQTPVLVGDSSTVLPDSDVGNSTLQPISLRYIPTVVGPKATPARLLHMLKLLNQNELAEAVATVLESAHIRRL